jgi:hypothetical protein
MKPDSRSFLGVLLAVGVACAHARPATVARQARTEKVFVTGSHIAQPVDGSASGLPRTTSPLRVYSRSQIEGTGRAYDLRAALRDLDPAITH